MPDPLKALNKIPSTPEASVIFMKDFHRFIDNVQIMRTIKNMIPILKATDRHILFIGPTVKIPVELEKDITIMPFDLPSADDLAAIASKLAADAEESNGVKIM